MASHCLSKKPASFLVMVLLGVGAVVGSGREARADTVANYTAYFGPTCNVSCSPGSYYWQFYAYGVDPSGAPILVQLSCDSAGIFYINGTAVTGVDSYNVSNLPYIFPGVRFNWDDLNFVTQWNFETGSNGATTLWYSLAQQIHAHALEGSDANKNIINSLGNCGTTNGQPNCCCNRIMPAEGVPNPYTADKAYNAYPSGSPVADVTLNSDFSPSYDHTHLRYTGGFTDPGVATDTTGIPIPIPGFNDSSSVFYVSTSPLAVIFGDTGTAVDTVRSLIRIWTGVWWAMIFANKIFKVLREY